MSIWNIGIQDEITIEVGYTTLSEEELADVKSQTPFESPFLGGIRTSRGVHLNASRPNGRFRMVDENAAKEVRQRIRQRNAEQFTLLVEAENALNEIFNIDPYQATTESGVRTISCK